MKQIPNIFTLLNLVCGCIAIVLTLQVGQSIVILREGAGTLAVDPFSLKNLAGGIFSFL